MVDVKVLKEQLQDYCTEYGIKYKYIAKEINVSESMLSHWRAGRKQLSESNLRQLQELIKIN